MAATSVEIVTGPSSLGVVDGNTNFSALKTTPRPQEYGTLGHYSIVGVSGAIAAGATANTQVFYARNTSATNLMLIQQLSLEGMIATTAFVAGTIQMVAKVARSFTAENGTPGQTALTITGNNAKTRTSMGTTSMAVIRIANTGTIADPVWTLDSQGFGSILTHSSGGYQTATPIIGSIYLPDTDFFRAEAGDHPIVLAQNEGIAIMATVPATGVWSFAVQMRWAEVLAY